MALSDDSFVGRGDVIGRKGEHDSPTHPCRLNKRSRLQMSPKTPTT